MADINAPSVIQITDANGNPVPGAKAYFYDTGTTTPRTVYSNTAGTTPHASPVVADSGGFLPPIYVTATVKMDVKTAADAAVPGYPVDPAVRVNLVGAAAAAISYNPHPETAETNVQDALDSLSDRFAGGGTRQVIGWNGTDAVWQDRVTLGTNTNASSTAVDFTGIPAGVRLIFITLNAVSLSGTDSLLIQIGDSGGVETTGYGSGSLFLQHTASVAASSSTNGFAYTLGNAARSATGLVILALNDATANRWSSTGSAVVETGGSAAVSTASGDKGLSATLDRVRITTTGSNTFDAGSINIGYI